MSLVKRTPPSTPKIEVQRASSNPNITDKTRDADLFNITQRSKRPRSESSNSNANELENFKTEIREMLTEWKSDQDASLKTFMSKITHELSELKLQNEKLQDIKIEIQESASLINEKYEEVKLRLDKLENERSEHRKYINKLEMQLKDIQESRRSAVIELRNIAHTEKEDNSHLIKTFVGACTALEVPVDQTEIRDIYRLQGKHGPSKQIIVELHSVTKKNNILSALREFNKGKANTEKLNSGHIGLTGERFPIYIADRPPASIRQLFYETRKFSKSQGYQFCWLANDKIFLRKREGEKSVRIESTQCFNKLQYVEE
ncbi:hypothetical protein PYW08_000191 [Mythimna loreyi]|uniref:Uncharacterized protein n=1 Tax=Mythimna loreyi TaxID=667449 RepID=A0ACC2RA27_9NEOP|nr:hypothetical protein PYW08_000191 [Mythimna loreyi]